MILNGEKIEPGERCMSTMIDLRVDDMIKSGIPLDDIAYGTASMIVNRELSHNAGVILRK